VGPHGPVSPHRFFVRVEGAESLQVTMAGEGEPVVLIPGLFGSAYAFRHLLEQLPAAGYRAIVIEPLGIGTSARPEKGDYSLTRQADRIATVLRELHTGPATVVAHSTGASMALRLAYRQPALVSAIVSLDGGPAERATSRGFRRAMQYVPWIKWMGGVKRVRAKIRESLVETSGDTAWVTEEVVDGYTAGARQDLDGTLKAYLRMAESKDEGVVDHRNEVFGYEGLFCIDSSAIPTSLGVNPSLTISAVSERAAALLVDRAADYGLPAKPAGFAPGVPGVFLGPHTTPVRRSSDDAIDAKVRSYA